MRICMFIRSLPIHAIGGMELHCETLSKTLSKMGIDLTVITTSHPKGILNEEKDGVKIYYLKNAPSGKYSLNWWKGSVEKFQELNSLKPFDLVHSQSAGAYSFLRKGLNKKLNIPVIVSLHGTTIDEIKTKIRLGFKARAMLGLLKHIFYYFFGDRFYLGKADAIIATSDKQKETIEKHFPVRKEKIHLVYNGIDENLFKPDMPSQELLKRLNINSENKIMLCVARLKEEKGIQNIIAVVPAIITKYPNIKLLVIGEGEYKNNLERMVKKLDISSKVWFLGSVEYNSLNRYFCLCDIFVNSTIRENGYDLTIIQAMSCGKPVVVSDIKAVFPVINDKINGFIYPKNKIEQLEYVILSLLKNKTLCEKIGSEARKTVVQKFGLETMGRKTIEVYKKVLGAGR